MADDKTKPGEQSVVGGGSAYRGQASAAGDIEWNGPGAEKIRRLLESRPKRCSVRVEQDGRALVVSYVAPRHGCVVPLVIAGMIVLAVLGVLAFSGELRVRSMLSFMLRAFAMAITAALWMGLVRILGHSRLCLVLEPDVATLEWRDLFPKVLWWVPRGAVKAVSVCHPVWPSSSITPGKSFWVRLRADRDYVVTDAPTEGLVWLANVLAAWSGKALVREGY